MISASLYYRDYPCRWWEPLNQRYSTPSVKPFELISISHPWDFLFRRHGFVYNVGNVKQCEKRQHSLHDYRIHRLSHLCPSKLQSKIVTANFVFRYKLSLYIIWAILLSKQIDGIYRYIFWLFVYFYAYRIVLFLMNRIDNELCLWLERVIIRYPEWDVDT